jgi:hypothetical protein
MICLSLFTRSEIVREHRRLSSNQWCASYICKGPLGLLRNLGGPCSSPALVPHRCAETACVPSCTELRWFIKPQEQNTWLSHLWLEHFYILILSLVEDAYIFWLIFVNPELRKKGLESSETKVFTWFCRLIITRTYEPSLLCESSQLFLKIKRNCEIS